MIVLCKWNTQIRNWHKQQKSKNNGTFAEGFSTNETDDETNTKDPGSVPEKNGHKEVLIKKKFWKIIFWKKITQICTTFLQVFHLVPFAQRVQKQQVKFRQILKHKYSIVHKSSIFLIRSQKFRSQNKDYHSVKGSKFSWIKIPYIWFFSTPWRCYKCPEQFFIQIPELYSHEILVVFLENFN